MKCSFAIACASILLAASAFADARTDLLKHVGIDQNIGAVVPADIVFRDETGRTVRLGDYYGKRPIILSLVYHGCPMLCSTVLSELGVSLNVMPPSAGEEFDILTISFDARDTPEIAARKKDEYLRHYQRPHAAEGWHFLTGDQASIDRLTQAVGFRYLADPQFAGQFIHAGGILVLTPSGKISRYFYGINYAPKDLRLALIEAGEEKSGSLSDAVLLFCFHYDPSSGRYTLAVLSLLRAGAGMTLLAIGGFWWSSGRRAKSGIADRSKAGAAPHPDNLRSTGASDLTDV